MTYIDGAAANQHDYRPRLYIERSRWQCPHCSKWVIEAGAVICSGETFQLHLGFERQKNVRSRKENVYEHELQVRAVKLFGSMLYK